MPEAVAVVAQDGQGATRGGSVVIAELVPFSIEFQQGAIEDLRERLRRTRWPERQTVDDWSQGVPLEYLQDLCRYWMDGYDFEAAAARLGARPQFRVMLANWHRAICYKRRPGWGRPFVWKRVDGTVRSGPRNRCQSEGGVGST